MISATDTRRTVSVNEACEALGISRQTGHRLIKAGTFPVPTLQLGSRTRVPVMPLLRVLGDAPT